MAIMLESVLSHNGPYVRLQEQLVVFVRMSRIVTKVVQHIHNFSVTQRPGFPSEHPRHDGHGVLFVISHGVKRVETAKPLVDSQ